MTTTDQRAAFIRAICEEPFDDSPRLQYADWLMEQESGIHRDLGRLIAGGLREGEEGCGFLDTYSATSADWLVHGPILVTQHPIIRVEIMDKEPGAVAPSQFAWFLDRSEDGVVDSEDIPNVWFVRLSDGHYWTTFVNHWVVRSYSSVTKAHDDLSRAAIDWARAEAGLPALDWSKKR